MNSGTNMLPVTWDQGPRAAAEEEEEEVAAVGAGALREPSED